MTRVATTTSRSRVAVQVALRATSIGLQALVMLGVGFVAPKAAFGEFVVVTAGAGIGATLCAGGSAHGALRLAHLLGAGNRWAGPTCRMLLSSAIRRSALAALLTASLLAFSPSLSPACIAAGAVMAMALGFSMSSQGLVVASGRALTSQSIDLLVRAPTLMIGLVALWRSDAMSGPAIALVASGSSLAQSGALMAVLPLRANPSQRLPDRAVALVARFVNGASRNATLFAVFSSADVYVGSLVMPATSIASMGIATRVSAATGMLHGAIFDHHASGIATALRRRDNGPLRQILRSIRLESSLATIAIAVVASASMALSWQYLPPTYREAAWLLAILLAARLLAGVVGPMPALLTLGGGQQALTRITLAAAFLVCIGASALGAWLGASGLAIASACGLATYSVLALGAVRRVQKAGNGPGSAAATSLSAQRAAHSAAGSLARGDA